MSYKVNSKLCRGNGPLLSGGPRPKKRAFLISTQAKRAGMQIQPCCLFCISELFTGSKSHFKLPPGCPVPR